MTTYLAPPKAGKCPVCAVAHPPDQPHDAQSLYYQYWFYNRYEKWPTWADALAHCDKEMRKIWKQGLLKKNAWSEPQGDVKPIVNNPEEHQIEMIDLSPTVQVRVSKNKD